MEENLAGWLADNQLVQLKLENRWPALSSSETTVQAAGSRWYPLARRGNGNPAAAGAGCRGPSR
jgi:hypothetical protein